MRLPDNFEYLDVETFCATHRYNIVHIRNLIRYREKNGLEKAVLILKGWKYVHVKTFLDYLKK